MKPIRMYLDEAENRGVVRNDAEIATRIGVARSAVSRWRAGERAPDDEQAIALAELLGIPEGEMLAECAAARAKSPATRAAWERIAKLASTTTACLVLTAANFFFSPSTAEAAPMLKTEAPHFVLCKLVNWIRRLMKTAVTALRPWPA